ncbi:unnamed protein product [Hydatigera taeniaeformis]|uniref:Secreted protein n=1 Tax=Hydatigena taeniaeformis TaxID=6205 RepID=A0A0R3WR30_HYDTA|nr:unnamed protein product [Hydatigera taeniaeformis]
MIALLVIILLCLGYDYVKTSAFELPWDQRSEISSTQSPDDQSQTEESNGSMTVEAEAQKEISDSLNSTQKPPEPDTGVVSSESMGSLATSIPGFALLASGSTVTPTTKTSDNSALNTSSDQSSTPNPPTLISTKNKTETLPLRNETSMAVSQKKANAAHNPLAHYSEADQAWLSADSFESETVFDEFSIDPCQFLTDQINHHLPYHISRNMMHDFAIRYDFGHLNDYRYISIEKQLQACAEY